MEKLEINTRAKPKDGVPYHPATLTDALAVFKGEKPGILCHRTFGGAYVPSPVTQIDEGWVKYKFQEGHLQIDPTKKNVFYRPWIYVFSGSSSGEKMAMIGRNTIADFDEVKKHPFFKRWAGEVVQVTVEKDTYVNF